MAKRLHVDVVKDEIEEEGNMELGCQGKGRMGCTGWLDQGGSRTRNGKSARGGRDARTQKLRRRRRRRRRKKGAGMQGGGRES